MPTPTPDEVFSLLQVSRMGLIVCAFVGTLALLAEYAQKHEGRLPWRADPTAPDTDDDLKRWGLLLFCGGMVTFAVLFYVVTGWFLPDPPATTNHPTTPSTSISLSKTGDER